MRLFKWLFQYIRGLLKTTEVPEIPKDEPILYFDRLILFKNAPLIGKVFHQGRNMYRVVYKEWFRVVF